MLSNWLDASSTSNRYKQMYIKGFLDISGGNLILRNNNFYIQQGDISLNGRLLVNNDASLNKRLFVGNDVYISGNLHTNYPNDSIPINAISGGIPGSTGIFNVDISLNNNLFLNKDASLNSRLYVGKNSILNGDVSLNSRLVVSGKTTFNSDVSLNSRLFVNGNITTSNLNATSIYENNILLTSKYATISSLGSYVSTSSANFTVTPTAPTAASGTNTTQLATTSYVITEISGIIGNAPTKLNTLEEIAKAINNDASYSFTVTSTFAPISKPTFLTSLTTPKIFATSDASFLGKFYLVGDASMNANLSVAKNIFEGGSSLTSKYSKIASPTFTGTVEIPTVNITQQLVSRGDISLNSRLFVHGDSSLNGNLTVNNYLSVLSDTTINSRLFVVNDTSLNGNLYVNKDLIVDGNLVANQYFTNMTIYTLSYEFIVAKDMSLNGRLFMTGDASINQRVFIGGDTSLNGNLFVNKNTVLKGDLNVNGSLTTITPGNSENSTKVATTQYVKNQGYAKLSGDFFTGDVSINSNLFVNGEIYEAGNSLISKYATLQSPIFTENVTLPTTTINDTLYVDSDVSMNGKLLVMNDVSMNTNLNVGGEIYEAGNSLVSKYSKIASPTFTGIVSLPTTSISNTLQVSSDVSMNTNLNVGGEIYEAGNSLVSKYSKIASPTFTGKVSLPTTTISDTLYVSSDVSMNGRLYVTNKVIMANDVSMNNNLDLSGSIIAHNNINVYGIINQYTTTLDQGYIVNYSNLDSSGDIVGNGIKLGKSTNGENTFLGINSGNIITSGINNTFLGYGAGSNTTTGSNNITIGNSSQSSSATVSNEITLGNNTITTLRCNIPTITSLSDRRDKTDIQDIPLGLNFIEEINPVKFTWNTRDGSKKDIVDFGFIAQDLKQAEEKIGVTVPNLIYDSNPDKLEASYSTLIPIMVKAIKELKKLAAKQQEEIEQLKNKLSA